MKVEIRSDHILVDGHVNAVGRDSRVIPDRRGNFVEQVVPGTFARALGRGNAIEFRHNHGRVLGGTATGELELREDSIGLRAKARITDAEIIQKARDKKLRGWSFGFKKIADEWEERTDAPSRRYLKDIVLSEVTLVDDTKLPAYPATSVELRGTEESITEYRSSEDEPEYDEERTTPPPADNPAADEPDAETKTANTETLIAGYKARRLKLGKQ